MNSYRTIRKIAGGFCSFMSKYTNYFFQIKILPKNVDRPVELHTKSKLNKDEAAIILQGPLYTRESFTVKTIRLYRQIFPNAMLIVSTWSDENAEMLKAIEEQGCVVIKTKPMEFGGCNNINRQLTTSKKGVCYAKEHGAKYIMKSRTDQRMYSPDAIDYMKALVDKFPVPPGEGGPMARMVMVDMFGSKPFDVYPFWLQDYMYFGRAEDMDMMFSMEESSLPYKNTAEYMNQHHIRTMTDEEKIRAGLVPEYTFLSNYFKSFFPEGNFGDKDYFEECARKYLAVISPYEIDLYWAYRRGAYFQKMSLIEEDGLCESYNRNIQKFLIEAGEELDGKCDSSEGRDEGHAIK